jgi:hypothetical protein
MQRLVAGQAPEAVPSSGPQPPAPPTVLPTAQRRVGLLTHTLLASTVRPRAALTDPATPHSPAMPEGPTAWDGPAALTGSEPVDDPSPRHGTVTVDQSVARYAPAGAMFPAMPVASAAAMPVVASAAVEPVASAQPALGSSPLPRAAAAGSADPSPLAQRDAESGPAPAEPTVAQPVPAEPVAAVPPTAAASAPASATPATPGATTPEQLDDLARRLMGPLTRRLKAEIVLDRERRGMRADVR